MTVIEQKQEILEQNVFKIGHSDIESQTFLPQMVRREGDTTNSLYLDIAGLQDKSGALIRFVNLFVIKMLFRKATSLRFIIPLASKSKDLAKG